MIEKKSITNNIASMKLCHLKELSKVFEIQISRRKKKDFIEDISVYMENNISEVLYNFIIYDEYKFIKKLYDENYTIVLKENNKRDEEMIKSLEYLGIVYTYSNYNEKKISIPNELKENIKSEILNTEVINHYKMNQEIVELFKNLLDVYGAIPMNILIDYIIEYLRSDNEAYKAIKFLWRYNFRYNLYYSDNKLNYYNTKIIDMRSLNEKLINNSNLDYKYYNISQLKSMCNRNLNYIENQIYTILKRYFKSPEFTLEYLDCIRTMIKNDIASGEISKLIMQETKRMSEQSRKQIEKLIFCLKEYYPVWTVKGHFYKDLECKSQS